jgi:hypothetical protein
MYMKDNAINIVVINLLCLSETTRLLSDLDGMLAY